MKDPRTPRLDDADAERFRRQTVECILELQSLPASTLRVASSIALPDAVETRVVHKLGRVPVFVGVSAIRGASTSGRVEELRTSNDREQVVVLRATGYGATVTVDVLVV